MRNKKWRFGKIEDNPRKNQVTLYKRGATQQCYCTGIANLGSLVRHEVVSAFVNNRIKSVSNPVFCHGYPIGVCVNGKTI